MRLRLATPADDPAASASLASRDGVGAAVLGQCRRRFPAGSLVATAGGGSAEAEAPTGALACVRVASAAALASADARSVAELHRDDGGVWLVAGVYTARASDDAAAEAVAELLLRHAILLARLAGGVRAVIVPARFRPRAHAAPAPSVVAQAREPAVARLLARGARDPVDVVKLLLLCAPHVHAFRGDQSVIPSPTGEDETAWLAGHGPPSCAVLHCYARPDALLRGGGGGKDDDATRAAGHSRIERSPSATPRLLPSISASVLMPRLLRATIA